MQISMVVVPSPVVDSPVVASVVESEVSPVVDSEVSPAVARPVQSGGAFGRPRDGQGDRLGVFVQAGWGDACEVPPDNVTACQAAAEQINQVLAECGQPTEPLWKRCPAFLPELCLDCTEYYPCFANGWSCEPDGVHVIHGNCACK